MLYCLDDIQIRFPSGDDTITLGEFTLAASSAVGVSAFSFDLTIMASANLGSALGTYFEQDKILHKLWYS
jgi:hypothetical protein